MAKKKRSQRKRNLAYARRQAGKQEIHKTEQSVDQVEAPEVISKPEKTKDVSVVQLPYLRNDLRKIMILASACIGLEIVLWILLQHTGLGTKVFGI